MSIALVASSFESSPDGSNLSGAAFMDSSGANLIVVGIADLQSVAASTVSDSKGNTPSYSAEYKNTTGGSRIRLAYFPNPTVGAFHTFNTSNGSTAYPAIVVYAFSGVDTSSPLDTSIGNGSPGVGADTIQPGSITPAAANYLLVTFMSINFNTTEATITAPFSTPLIAPAVGGGSFSCSGAYEIQSGGPTARNPTWTTTPWVDPAAVMASFKVAAAAASLPYLLVKN